MTTLSHKILKLYFIPVFYPTIHIPIYTIKFNSWVSCIITTSEASIIKLAIWMAVKGKEKHYFASI